MGRQAKPKNFKIYSIVKKKKSGRHTRYEVRCVREKETRILSIADFLDAEQHVEKFYRTQEKLCAQTKFTKTVLRRMRDKEELIAHTLEDLVLRDKDLPEYVALLAVHLRQRINSIEMNNNHAWAPIIRNLLGLAKEINRKVGPSDRLPPEAFLLKHVGKVDEDAMKEQETEEKIKSDEEDQDSMEVEETDSAENSQDSGVDYDSGSEVHVDLMFPSLPSTPNSATRSSLASFIGTPNWNRYMFEGIRDASFIFEDLGIVIGQPKKVLEKTTEEDVITLDDSIICLD